MAHGKKGVELSVNFIIGLIIAFVVFFAGIYLLRSITRQSDDFLKQNAEDFESQIETLACDGNEYVCVGITEKTARRGETAVYTLAILNSYDSQKNFIVSVEPRIMPAGASASAVQFFPRADEKFRAGIDEVIKVPVALHAVKGALSGTYSFRVNVTEEGSPDVYGAPQILYLIVT
jgi:hypothetical protein